MARIRTIKPEFWEDEKIAKLPFPCRLFYIGCWNFADDLGVIKSNATLLKSWIFPYDEDLRVSEIKKWIDALVDARMFVPIISNGESYYIIRTFRNHQVLDKRYERSYLPKGLAHKMIEDALRDSIETTMCSHSNHIVNTTAEMEMEMEKEYKEKELSNDSPTKKETSSFPQAENKFFEDDTPQEKVDYNRIVDMYHKACPDYPRLIKLSDKRKAKIRVRFEEMKYDYKTVATIFCKMQASKFLKGDNKNGWKASFDWVFENANNWVKVLEGQYDNKEPQPTQQNSGVKLGKGEWITQDGRRTYGTGRANIPMDAPPRPSEQYSWSAETNKWMVL